MTLLLWRKGFNGIKGFCLSVLLAYGGLLAIPVMAASAESEQSVSIPININQADAETIAMAIKGIGSRKAAAIVKYREEYGLFESLDELLDVKGIGEATLDKNRSRIVLE